jgi:transposase-like protein
MSSLIFNVPIVNVFCPYCAHPHQDWNKWAVHPHINHLCERCGAVFQADTYGVSRPTFSPVYADRFNQPPVVQEG